MITNLDNIQAELDERLNTERSPIRRTETVINERKVINTSNYNSNNNMTNNNNSNNKIIKNKADSKDKNNNATEPNPSINVQKSTNLHIIQIPLQKNNQTSPEKTSQLPQVNKNVYNTNKIINSKGLNIIPIKSNLNMMTSNYNSNNKEDIKLDKLSPKVLNTNKMTGLNSNYNTNLSPKNGIFMQNSKIVTSTTKMINEMRLTNEIKANYKSPSPSRGTNTTTTRYLKKSPEIRK